MRVPDEFDGLLRACDTKPLDSAPKLATADWLLERGYGRLGYAFRWMAKRGRWPLSFWSYPAPRFYWLQTPKLDGWGPKHGHLPNIFSYASCGGLFRWYDRLFEPVAHLAHALDYHKRYFS
jgi:uncharacterized protein (TIGR02996 family)